MSANLFEPASTARARFLAIGRFILFAILFYALLLAFATITNRLPFGSGIAAQALAGNLAAALAALASALCMARIDGSPFSIFGFRRPAVRPCINGALLGFILLSCLLLTMCAFTGFRLTPLPFHGFETLTTALLYLCLFSAVAVSEETLWRGYALVTLSEAISFWPAALVLGLIFGLAHRGETLSPCYRQRRAFLKTE